MDANVILTKMAVPFCADVAGFIIYFKGRDFPLLAKLVGVRAALHVPVTRVQRLMIVEVEAALLVLERQ